MTYGDVDHDSGVFDAIGAAFDVSARMRVGGVGPAQCRLMRERDAVDFAVEWLERDRA